MGGEDAVELGDDGGVGLFDVLDAGFEHAHAAPSFPGRMDSLDEAGILQRVDRMGDHVGLQVQYDAQILLPDGLGLGGGKLHEHAILRAVQAACFAKAFLQALMGKLERHEKR